MTLVRNYLYLTLMLCLICSTSAFKIANCASYSVLYLIVSEGSEAASDSGTAQIPRRGRQPDPSANTFKYITNHNLV